MRYLRCEILLCNNFLKGEITIVIIEISVKRFSIYRIVLSNMIFFFSIVNVSEIIVLVAILRDSKNRVLSCEISIVTIVFSVVRSRHFSRRAK